jgi:tetratricopeptide (TPR) repeat protein
MRLLVLALLTAPAFARTAPVAEPKPLGAPPAQAPVGQADRPQSTGPAQPMPDAGPAAAPAPAAVAGWAGRFDELWKTRDRDSALKEMRKLVDEQLASDPKSFEANWRLASLLNWEANGYEGDKKADLGHAAWEAGDRAIQAKPDDVRAQYQAGTGIGLYSEGVGILTALAQGLEGKFRDRMQAALRIDKDHLDGAPQVVWGRYFFKLPWPKRNVDESIRVLMEAVRTHPNNWRAKIYLADSLADDGKTEDARRWVQDVLDARGGDDPPEEKRLKDMAKKWMGQH